MSKRRTITNARSLNQIKFAVEVETILDKAPCDTIRRNYGLSTYRAPFGQWKAKGDGSIHTQAYLEDGDDYEDDTQCGVEFNSPIMTWNTGLCEVRDFVKVLNTMGADPNYTCGIHIHVDWPADKSPDDLRKLARYFASYESAIFAMTGETERLENTHGRTHFCKPIKAQMAEDSQESWSIGHGDYRRGVVCPLDYRDRYYSMNITNVFPYRNEEKHTVEFRLFPSVTNPVVVVGFVNAILAIVEKAENSKRAPAPRFAPHSARRDYTLADHYTRETARFMNRVGWTPGAYSNSPLGFFAEGNPYATKTIADALTENAIRYASEALI